MLQVFPEIPDCIFTTLKLKTTTLERRDKQDIEFHIQNYYPLDTPLLSNSDILKGVYEGGLKTWESSIDLVLYIEDHIHPGNSHILELGCGSGLPSIYLAKIGYKVDFQDFNKDVLDLVTIPNLMANITYDSLNLGEIPHRFFYGSWSDAVGLRDSYDIIISCETIYDSDSNDALLDIIQGKLSAQGVCFIAAKKIYFGCSGSLEIFKEAAMKRGLNCTVMWQSEKGVKREIVQVSR